MSNNKYIGYRPEINYTDNYETEKGAFQYSQETAEESTSSSYSTGSNSIEDGINKIDTLLKGVFPSKLKDSIFEVYNPIKDAYNKYLKNQSIICFNNKDKYINNTVGKVIYGLYFDRNTLSIKKGTSKKLNVYVIPTNDETNKVES